jgi:hypothetical protein
MDYRDIAAYRRHNGKFDESRMVIILSLYDSEEDAEVEVEFPACLEVCYSCEGRGKYVHPDIDRNGITAREWHEEWSHEERDLYLHGGYDVRCEECQGLRVTPTFDIEVFSPEQDKFFQVFTEDMEMYEAWARESEAERRFGA